MSDSPGGTREVDGPAKVNLFLRILGRRPDGYHELETVIQPVSLADRLRVHAAADPDFRTLSLSLELTGDPELVRGVPVDEENLVLRAAAALAERAGVRGFAELSLDKRIPVAAGLGGGSADAAAALRALNDLWGCELTPGDLQAVGAAVGSDVPALIAGGPVLARGRGEVVEPVQVPPLHLVLVPFVQGIAARDAYRWWDEAESVAGPAAEAFLKAALRGDREALAASLHNDLEAAVVRRRPDVAAVLETLVRAGALRAIMTGSGPTVVGVMATAERLEPAAERELAEASGRQPLYVTSLPGSD